MSKRTTILLIVACIIFLLAGFWIGKVYERSLWQEKFYQVVRQELDWFKSQSEKYQYFQESLYHVSGTVIEKGGGFLMIEGRAQVLQSPLPEEPEKRNIKLNLNGETEIFRFVIAEESSQKVFLKFEDVKTGDYVFVVSKENVKDRDEVTAEKIQVSSFIEQL